MSRLSHLHILLRVSKWLATSYQYPSVFVAYITKQWLHIHVFCFVVLSTVWLSLHHGTSLVTPLKTNMTLEKSPFFNRKYIFKSWIFYCFCQFWRVDFQLILKV